MNVQKAILCGARVAQSGQKISPFGVKDITGARGTTLACRKTIHVTAQVKYPQAKHIPLPNNIEAIMSVEIGQFSPQRSRDISGPVIFSKSPDTFETHHHQMSFSKSFNQFVESYDCNGVCSLNSAMQSNVPTPFQAKGNVMHLNMPGGQWEQGCKFISEDMQKSHFLQVNKKKQGIRMFHTLTKTRNISPSFGFVLKRFDSTKASENNTEPLSRKEKLKRAVKEYGTTVIVFHVGISLISLGACYTLVSSGLDMEKFITYLPWIDESSKITQNAGTFVTAYAIHKIMAPIRISITLSSVPFIVRFMRTRGFLKPR